MTSRHLFLVWLAACSLSGSLLAAHARAQAGASTPTATIAGRVLDENGAPAGRAIVSALCYGNPGVPQAPPELQFRAYATADERGEFRLKDLQPGNYIVSARYAPRSARAAGSPVDGYAPTYYPGSAVLAGAKPVTAQAGETSNIEFRMIRARLARISGTALDSTGNPLRNARLSLVPRGEDAISAGGNGAFVNPDGTFLMFAIPPGDYDIVAQELRGSVDDARVDEFQVPAPREQAVVPVTVAGEDVVVNIRTSRGATISGRVVVEGREAPSVIAALAAPGKAPVTVSARHLWGPGTERLPGQPSMARPGKDGAFQLVGARGRTIVTAYADAAALVSVRRGSEDISTRVLDLSGTERIDGVVVTMTTDAGTLEGIVRDARGQPATAIVIAFPDDPPRWVSQPELNGVRALFARTDPPAPGLPAMKYAGPGRFVVPLLLPGRYAVVAFEPTERVPAFDRDGLGALKSRALLVTISAHQTTQVEVPVGKR